MPPEPPDHPPDLIDTLITAAGAAIRNERPSLERGPGRVRSLTVEVDIRQDGRLGEVRAFVERRSPYEGLSPRRSEAP